jgi:tetratricopeptide (TPR) repeat protein
MKKALSMLVLTGMVFGFMAFSCSSKEITSAKLYIQQKKYDKALSALNEEISKNPKSDEGYKLMGDVYGIKGDYKKMVKSYDESLSISNKFQKQIAIAKKAKWADSFNAGAAYYNRATKQNAPDSAKKLYNKAIKSFNDAIICEPDSAKSYEYKAYAYFNMGELEKAIPPLKKVVALTPSKEIYVRLGEITLQEGATKMNSFYQTKNTADSVAAMNYYKDAVKVLEEGRKKYPDDPGILSDLANAYVSAKMLDVAMDAFKEGVAKDPNNKTYRYNYGVLLLGDKQFDKAVEEFKAALKLDPNYLNAKYNLGVAYIKWGAAVRDEAVANGKEDDTAYLDKFKAALPYLEDYLAAKPDDVTIWELLGKVYANLGMTEKSKEAYQKADQMK